MSDRLKQLTSHLSESRQRLAVLQQNRPDDVAITMAIRSPMCKAKKGGFKDTRIDELMLEMFKQAIAYSKVDPNVVGDICVGTVLTPDAVYHARAAALAAGFPESVPVQSINRFCSSGLMAVTTIANQIRAGQIDVGLAIGIESMSQNPDNGGPPQSDEVAANSSSRDCPKPMGWTSENVALDYDISREDMDDFAAKSFQRAEHAQKEGYFAKEIVPFRAYQKDPSTGVRTKTVVTKDDGIRYGTTKENLLKIRSAFPQWGKAATTGGNASQITDGAAALMLMSRRKAEQLGMKILGKYITTAVVGVPPRVMGVGPVYAIPAALRNCGIIQEDVDLFEINEAFASQCVYSIQALGIDPEKVNVNGGAIALGHPLDKYAALVHDKLSRDSTSWNEEKERCSLHRCVLGLAWEQLVFLLLNSLGSHTINTIIYLIFTFVSIFGLAKVAVSFSRRTKTAFARCHHLSQNYPPLTRLFLSRFPRPSFSSLTFLLAAANMRYDSIQSGSSPYIAVDPYYNESSGFIHLRPPKKRTSNWVKFGIPILVLVVIAGAVVGGIFGSKKSKSSGAGSASGEAAASSAASVKLAIGRFATGTNSEFMRPLYPSTTNTAAFTTPTFIPTNNAALSWPEDPFTPSNPSPTTTRTDRPRLIAPAYKWAALPALIKNDPYLQGWNNTIFGNATEYYGLAPVTYFMDGPSGILDNAREIKMRIKAFAYVYRMTNDTKWIDRTWSELQNAASFGPATDKWNPEHFLDTAEMSAAFGIAYDWLYNIWTSDQRSQIMANLIKYGLQPGITAYTDPTSVFGWWRTNTTGNWNCVCNSGLTLASLAILGDDTSGIASQLLGLTVDNAKQNCALAVSDDGTWAETANYWYFGTTGHAEMAASLISATGSHYGLLDVNPNFQLTGVYHMYSMGTTSLFNYGDHGPNKFSSTANTMLFYARQYNQPQFSLFQRDQDDAAEPWSMFWYDPSVSGAFWDGAPLDHFFNNGLDQWASMRSSWTDSNALYVAMKAGKNQGHQTHNDLDAGDFVLDALGTRWAGELGSSDYRSPNYFSSDTQGSDRWKYYRKMTEGQNTILVSQANQNVLAAPTVQNGSSGTTQGSSTVVSIPSDSTAFFTADLTSAYFNVTSFKRGVRLINARKQVLIQDDITSQGPIQWRMHTNATVSIDSGGTSATLTLDGQTMKISILNPPSGVTMNTTAAIRFATDPTPPAPDPPNPGVTVLVISLNAGTYSLQVLFNPQWSGMSSSDFVTPPSVAIDKWSLTSHN